MKRSIALVRTIRIGMCSVLLYSSAVMFATAWCALPASGGSNQVGQAVGLIVAGDGMRALELLRALDRSALSNEAEQASQCMLSRLEDRVVDIERADLTGAVLSIYQAYWRDAVMEEPPHAAAQARRRSALAALFGLESSTEEHRLESAIRNALYQAGNFARLGVTPPFNDLILWRTQKLQDFTVVLPEGNQTTRVAIMGGVLANGWSDYLTCGLAGAGGWADRDIVYVIPEHFPAGLNDNRFLASLLTHESQHMADYATFGKLPAWQLEYRAKLAELWRSDEANAHRLVATFRLMQSASIDAPHPYANQRVLKALENRLKSDTDAASIQRIERVTLELLREDSRALRNVVSGASHLQKRGGAERWLPRH